MMVLDCLTQVNYGPPSRSSASTSYISETTDTNWTNTTAITKDSSLSTNMVDLMNRHDQSLPPSPVNVEHLAGSLYKYDMIRDLLVKLSYGSVRCI